MSIFEGMDALVKRHLMISGKGDFGQASFLHSLTPNAFESVDNVALVHSLYKHTEARWLDVNGRSPRKASDQNWRFTLNTKMSAGNPSPEKQLEKRIAQLAEKRGDSD